MSIFNLYLLPPLIQFVFSVALAVIVMNKRPQEMKHKLFIAYLLSIAGMAIYTFAMRASPDTRHAAFWERWFTPPCSLYVATVFYHFSLHFTHKKINKWILRSLYACCICLIPFGTTDLLITGTMLLPNGYSTTFTPGGYAILLVGFILSLLVLRNFIAYYRNTYRIEERNRTLYIIIGYIIFITGGIVDTIMSFGVNTYPSFILGNIIFCIITTFAIVKYNLLDIRDVLHKSAIHIVASLLIGVPFATLFFISISLFTKMPQWFYATLLFGLSFMVFPFWGLAQRTVDRWFYRDRYNYLKALENFSSKLQNFDESEQLMSEFVHLMAGALRCREVALLQPGLNNDFIMVASTAQSGTLFLKNQNPILNYLRQNREVVFVKDIEQLLDTVDYDGKSLYEANIALLVPLIIHETHLSGIILLGSKLSGKSYNMEDLRLIRTMSRHMAIILENNRLYSQAVKTQNDLGKWFNTMKDCIIIADVNCSVLFMNRNAVKNFQIAHYCWQTIGKGRQCEDCPQLHQGSSVLPRTEFIKGRQYEITSAPFSDSDGSESIIEVLRDVTEKNKLEQEIIETRIKVKSLIDSENFKNELLSMVSHELRTPLTLIKGYATQLIRHVEAKESEKDIMLTNITMEADRLAKLVNNLLDMSRIEAGNLELKKEPYSVYDIVLSVRNSLYCLSRNHQLVINVTEDSSLPVVIVDRVRIGQVLLNLCDNAVKFSPQNTPIIVDAIAEGDMVLISVTDKGEGIPYGIQSNVFDRFNRTDHEQIKQTGVGLGLSICRGIIEAHGGKIWFESKAGAGSKFSFSLPVAARVEVGNENTGS